MILKTPRIISIILIVLILIVTAGTMISIATETRSALKESVQDKLMTSASIAASQIDGDEFAKIQIGDEDTPEFIMIRDQLHRIKDATQDILYIYTMRMSGDTVEFVVDGDYGYLDNTPLIGEPYPEAEPELYLGFTGPSVDEEFTTDQWGTVLSGFSHIKDSAGNVVGIVGLDMDSTVVTEEINALNLVFYLVGLIIMISAAAGIFVIERREAENQKKLEESERKYRRIFEIAGDCIMIFEAEGENRGRIIAANPSAARMHGYSVDELLEMKATDLDTPESRVSAPGRFERILNGEMITGEVTHIRRDGTVFPMEINSGLLEMGNKKYVLAIDRDISERKRAENALKHATKKLNLLNIITFSDIKNAIFSVSGYIELQRQSISDERQMEFLDKESSLIRQVENRITFARNYQNLGLTPPAWQNVNNAFLYGISHLEMSLISRNIDVDGLEIYADPLLETVFFNLADNVLEHGKTATAISLYYEKSGDDIKIVMEDNGVGIPDEMKMVIFDQRHERKEGLGLFLVREILDITGISITERGEYGKGARFEMIIPKDNYRFK